MIARGPHPLLFCAAAALLPAGGGAQTRAEPWPHAAVLEQQSPETYRQLVRLYRADGLALDRLSEEGRAVRARGGGAPTAGFEAELLERLTSLVTGHGAAEELAEEAEIEYARLGPDAHGVLGRGRAFQLEVLGILVDPSTEDRRAALAEAVERYRSRPDVSVASAPKDMDIVYDHAHAFALRTRYPKLAGFLWAELWYALAATEPLTDIPAGDPRRAAGLDTVAARFHAKLTPGEPPRTFPSQIPLAPAIAPGFIFLSPQAAMIWDNLSLLREVIGDILASPDVDDPRRAIDEAVRLFVDPDARVTDRGTWEHMALTHGIFFQGGYPLDEMTRSELNGDGHAAHLGGGGAAGPMPVVPN